MKLLCFGEMRVTRRAVAKQKPHARPVQDILVRMRRAITGPVVTIETILRAMDPGAQAVLLLLPALILVTPLSGIPGLSSLGGLTIALVAVQMLLGRPMIWLPAFVLRRQLSSDRLQRALIRLDGAARFIDRRSGARAERFFAFPGQQLALIICLACGLAMPFLELVPFSATTLAMVVTLLASALLVRDGLLTAIGLGGFGFAIMIIVRMAVA